MKSLIKMFGLALFIVGFFAIGAELVTLFEGAIAVVIGFALAIIP